MAKKDYYQVLGVDKKASADEIRRAFRRLAQEHHPDKGGDAEKFKEINEAYQILSDDKKRAQYDQFGAAFDGAGAGPGGFNWGDFSQGFGGFQGANGAQGSAGMDDLGEMLGDLFGLGGRRGRQAGPRRGADLEVDLTIELKEAVFGTEKSIDLNKKNRCEHCHGTGAEPGHKVVTCMNCRGTGQITVSQQTFLGQFQTVQTCGECRGSGRVPEKKCSICDGRGTKVRRNTIKLKIPAGIDNNEGIRLKGEGEAGDFAGPAGDLLVRIKVRPDLHFRRERNNIISREEIPFHVAALGGKVKVRTLAEEVELKIPTGTQSGQLFKLKGHGAPDIRGYSRGDQIVEIVIKVPQKLSGKQKKLLEELASELN